MSNDIWKIFCSKLRRNPASLLLLLHYPQHIPAKDLVNVSFGIAPVQQFASEIWELSDVRQVAGRCLDAVEIRPNANVIDSHQLHDVVDVIHDARYRYRWQTTGIFLLSDTVAGQLLMNRIALFGVGGLLDQRRNLQIDLFLLFAPTRLEMFRIEDDVDDATRLCQCDNHIVCEISRYGGDGTTCRVSGHDRFRRSVDD